MMHQEEENNEIEEEFSMSYNKNNTTGKVFFILLWIVVGLAGVMFFYMGLLYYASIYMIKVLRNGLSQKMGRQKSSLHHHQ